MYIDSWFPHPVFILASTSLFHTIFKTIHLKKVCFCTEVIWRQDVSWQCVLRICHLNTSHTVCFFFVFFYIFFFVCELPILVFHRTFTFAEFP